MKDLKIWKMERELRNERRVNVMLCLMAIGLCVLLVGTTGCATLSSVFHLKSDEAIEFEHALAATHGAPYEGNIPKIAALFAGLKAEDADLLEKNDLGKLAEVFEICHGIPIDVHLWPSPNGLGVRVKRECRHNLRGGGLAFDSREIGVNINELRFSEDPDVGLTREELATRYAGVFSYGIEPPANYPTRPYVPQEFRMNIVALLAVDAVAKTNLHVMVDRTEDGGQKHGYRVEYNAIVTSRDALDHGLGKFARLVEEYAGNGDDIVTPWEVERFGSNAPFYIAIAHGLVAHSDFATLAKRGVRVNDVDRFAVQVASLWDTVGEDTIIVH